MEPINKFGSLGPSRFLNYNNPISIITSNRDGFELTCLQAFNLYGKRIKTINNSDKRTYSMAIYTNNQNENKKCFIIVGYDHFIISYDYNKNQVYKMYHDLNDKYNGSHLSIIVQDNQQMTKLIESSLDGNIRVWNFNSGELINKIKIDNESIYGICSINNGNLIIGCDNGQIKLVSVNKGDIQCFKNKFSKSITTVKTIRNNFEEILIAQSFGEGMINFYKLCY